MFSTFSFYLQPKDEPNYDTRSRWHNIVPGMRQVRFFLANSTQPRAHLYLHYRSSARRRRRCSLVATCSTRWSRAASTRWSSPATTTGGGQPTRSRSSSPPGPRVCVTCINATSYLNEDNLRNQLGERCPYLALSCARRVSET